MSAMNPLLFEKLGEPIQIKSVTKKRGPHRTQPKTIGAPVDLVGIFNESDLEVTISGLEERPSGIIVRINSGKEYAIIHNESSPAKTIIPGKLELWKCKLSHAK